MTAVPIDGNTLTNRLLAKLYLGQHRHRHGAIVDLISLGMPRSEVAVVLDLPEDEVQTILNEAAELASRAIGRPSTSS